MEQSRTFQIIASVFACCVVLPCLAMALLPFLVLGTPLFVALLVPLGLASASGGR